MAKLFASGLFLCLARTVSAQQPATTSTHPTSPASEVIDRTAWNSHDKSDVAASLYPQIRLRGVDGAMVICSGRAAFEQSAANFIATPHKPKSILRRITEDASVIDFERISGLANGQARKSTIIFEVRNGLVVGMQGLSEAAR